MVNFDHFLLGSFPDFLDPDVFGIFVGQERENLVDFLGGIVSVEETGLQNQFQLVIIMGFIREVVNDSLLYIFKVFGSPGVFLEDGVAGVHLGDH